MKIRKAVLALLLLFAIPAGMAKGQELIDRVVAFVNDQAITLSELKKTYEETRKKVPDIREEEVLGTMVNRLLLLREAQNLKITAASEEAMIKEYVDIKIKAFIMISPEEVDKFLQENKKDFAGVLTEEARGKIERYLQEKTVNDRLKALIETLRKKAYVKIQLAQPPSTTMKR